MIRNHPIIIVKVYNDKQLFVPISALIKYTFFYFIRHKNDCEIIAKEGLFWTFVVVSFDDDPSFCLSLGFGSFLGVENLPHDDGCI